MPETTFPKNVLPDRGDGGPTANSSVVQPGVALHLVQLACESPDLRGRSLSQCEFPASMRDGRGSALLS
jgi:hypothetical protein